MGSTSDCTDRIRMEKSAGLTLRKVGGLDRFEGSWREAELMALCTYSAAPSILRSSANCSVIRDTPSAFSELICTRHRSEEHTSVLQSRQQLVCRHLLENK